MSVTKILEQMTLYYSSKVPKFHAMRLAVFLTELGYIWSYPTRERNWRNIKDFDIYHLTLFPPNSNWGGTSHQMRAMTDFLKDGNSVCKKEASVGDRILCRREWSTTTSHQVAVGKNSRRKRSPERTRSGTPALHYRKKGILSRTLALAGESVLAESFSRRIEMAIPHTLPRSDAADFGKLVLSWSWISDRATLSATPQSFGGGESRIKRWREGKSDARRNYRKRVAISSGEVVYSYTTVRISRKGSIIC